MVLRMITIATLAFLLVPLVAVSQSRSAKSKSAMKSKEVMIDIPYKKFVLDNGLTLLVHEDHKAPIVAVNVWYHVGSKNEKPGKSGFAHLFEHLMFNGSENFNDDYFKVLEKLGATDLNGTTNEDRTNYFQNVPKTALDVVLWMESDRMGHLLGAIDQGKLDEQRGVVQNEKRQGENQPYGMTDELITKSTWPASHPYSHTVIGSMDDLNAASLADVKEWFKTSYGPSNAVLVVAGDIDAKTALEKVKKYFGDIPPGPPLARQKVWIAKRTGSQFQRMQDRVPQARLYRVWNIPQFGSAAATNLDLISDLLASGKTSRLYKRLVYDDQIATNVNSFVDLREIAGQFYIMVTAKPGEDLARIEKTVNEELTKFIKNGPTAKELRRVKTQYVANFTRGVERIGGFGGKSDILAHYQVFTGSADGYKTTLHRVQSVTAKQIQATAREWLSDGDYNLEVMPFPDYKADATADTTLRKAVPKAGPAPDVSFPTLERTTLANGLKVVLARRAAVPVVNFSLIFDAGYASDQFSSPGTANLAMNMMDEGTKKRSALQISEDLALLGANLSTGSNLDNSTVHFSALKANLDASLDIFADVVLHPSFPEADFQRLKRQTLAQIQREKVTPVQMALRVFSKLLYGKGHAYGNPLTGSGTEASVQKMTRKDLVKFHDTWVRPNNATLVVVGATTMKEIKPKIEALFRNWKSGTIPKKNIGTVSLPSKPMVYLIDKPGSQQSIIFAGNVTLPQNNPDEIPMSMVNTALGGAFISRINMNLREDKHWSYGAFTILYSAKGQRPFFAYGPVQTDKTKESMVEMSKELHDVVGSRPLTSEELDRVQSSRTLQLAGSWETANAVLNSISNIVRFGLPDTYYDTYAQKIKAVTVADLNSAAKELVKPDDLIWVVVGDRTKIESGIRELEYGELKFIDSDGNPVR